MANKKSSSQIINFPNKRLNVTTRSHQGELLDIDASGLYIQKKYDRLLLAYSGDQSEESYTTLQLPRDEKFLKQLGKKLIEMANDTE
ncbi:hypothetical protein ACIPTP_21955 [Pectobacterium versatile]|uniref:hypothetical protein n=1 Tax=Pectobacterium versatile TaxID=2488639 RepID=UPI0019378CA9|nr:hypothetical protein HG702_22255 [Pectobacterium versatile]